MDLEARNLQGCKMSICLPGSIQPILPLEIAENEGEKRYHHNFMFLVKNMCIVYGIQSSQIHHVWGVAQKKVSLRIFSLARWGPAPDQAR